MSIDLAAYEVGRPYTGNYAADLQAAQARLARLQVAHIVYQQRAIILFEGWDASGKGGTIQRLVAEWDPRWFAVWPIAAPSPEEKARHFLWRFWQRLPKAGQLAVFDRSWYGRVLVERVEGYAGDDEIRRGFHEINEFEAQQREDGTPVIKLFLHITQAEQDKRLAKRLSDPWKRFKSGADDFRNRSKRADYSAALDDMFAKTNTKWAPWRVIDGNDKQAARITALNYIADQLDQQVPRDPPKADPALIKLAERALGMKF
jgi:AMP-polyphosphate phosphotransferase